MIFSLLNPVCNFLISKKISTAYVFSKKLFITDNVLNRRLQTYFFVRQVVDFIQETVLIHRIRHCLTTTTIDY